MSAAAPAFAAALEPAASPVRDYVDTLGVAFRCRDWRLERRLNPHEQRGRPPLRFGGRVYRRLVHLHQPSAEALALVAERVEAGEAIVERIDAARDVLTERPAEADALHEAFRREAVLSWAAEPVRVHALGTSYWGAGQGEEGAALCAYSDGRAARKHGGWRLVAVEQALDTGSATVRFVANLTLSRGLRFRDAPRCGSYYCRVLSARAPLGDGTGLAHPQRAGREPNGTSREGGLTAARRPDTLPS